MRQNKTKKKIITQMCTILLLEVDSCLIESQLFTCQLVYMPNNFDFFICVFNLFSTIKNEELVLIQAAK